MKKLTIAEIAWMAGFLDGEGTILINKGHINSPGNVSYILQVSIENTHYVSLVRFREAFGGNIYTRKNKIKNHHKTGHIWTITSRDAYEFLRVIAPYLCGKRPEAELGIEYWELIGNEYRRGTMRTRLEKNGQEYYYHRLQELKHEQVESGVSSDTEKRQPPQSTQLRLLEEG